MKLITQGLGTGGGIFVVTQGMGGDLIGKPVLASAVAIDGHHLRISYNERVMPADALISSNYSITGGGGLTVLAVVMETETVYVLTTTLQTPGQLYTVTVSNVRDLDGNPI